MARGRGRGRGGGGSGRKVGGRRGRGPTLDSSFLRPFDGGRKKTKNAEVEKEEDGGLVKDLYEYEEGVPEEEAGRNRRFDEVEGAEYELPSDFEDEEIDEDAALGEEDAGLEGSMKTMGKNSDELDEGEFDLNSEDEESDEEENEGEDNSEDEEEGAEEEEEAEDDDDDDDHDHDHEKHQLMLEAVTGKSHQPRNENVKKQKKTVLSEACTESEFNVNPSRNGHASSISVEDLLGSLQGAPGIGTLRKRMQPLQKEKFAINAPLPRVLQERVERKVGYEKSRDEVTKWQPIVKQNREAPTLLFNERETIATTTVADLADKFKPVNDMEKEVAALLKQNKMEIEEEIQAAEALELNKLSVEEVRERQQRLSKMRSLLFQHEAKAKRVAKIKSKTFHRLDKSKRMRDFRETDEEAVKEAALKQETKRAEERMTLKHKNTSRWAKRILKRGLKAHEDGTRDAIMEQLRAHSMLTKKIQSVTMSSSEESSGDEEEETEEGAAVSEKGRSKLLAKAKAATFETLQFDTEAEPPKSGLFALPFMARAMEKKRNEAREEALAVLEQLEQAEANNEVADGDGASYEIGRDETEGAGHSGRLAFGDLAASSRAQSKRKPRLEETENDCSDLDLDIDNDDDDNDNVGTLEEGALVKKRQQHKQGVKKAFSKSKLEKVDLQGNQISKVKDSFEVKSQADIDHASSSINGASAAGMDISVTEDLPGIGSGSQEGRGSQITSTGFVQVSVFDNQTGFRSSQSAADIICTPARAGKDTRVGDLSRLAVSHTTSFLELDDDDGNQQENGLDLLGRNTSQQELIQRAFAGDDVEADFQDIKIRALDEEVVKVEEAKPLPGWGQWSHFQKKVQPGWKADIEKKKREEALKKRKDAKLQFVVISEKLDKKGAKYLASKVPFPMKSKEVFEKSMRMPIGREYNSEKVFRDMIRPAELKTAGVIIDPIKQDKSPKRPADVVQRHVTKRRRARFEKGSK